MQVMPERELSLRELSLREFSLSELSLNVFSMSVLLNSCGDILFTQICECAQNGNKEHPIKSNL